MNSRENDFCYDEKATRSWVEIDLSQIKKNYFIYKKQMPEDTVIVAVIKADAYGHGDIRVAKALQKEGCRFFAVSNIFEAIGLREAGIGGEILILGYTPPRFADTLIKYDLTQTLVSAEHAEALAKLNKNVKCQFAVNTGMNRIGLNADNAEDCAKIIRDYAGRLKINGIFTHFCTADTQDGESVCFTHTQAEKFRSVALGVKELALPYVHCCNSAAGLYHLGDVIDKPLMGRMVRLGIVLYGLKPDDSDILPDGIAPAMTWKSEIAVINELHKGDTVGYGRTYTAERTMRVATITTGYADGYNRLLSNRGFVLINGKKAPIIGRICMDQMTVDVTDIKDISAGSEVVLLGRSGDLVYTADDMAKAIGTIGYEIICNVTERVHRVYVRDN